MPDTLNNQQPGAFPVFSTQQHFENWVDGSYGRFETPAGALCYIQTKARLAGDASCYAKLTKALAPAREVLEIREMNFNQLLQRDLDDHRIAKDLIPYVLKPAVTGLPSFFPPIVAVLLPFNTRQQPEQSFPEPTETVEVDHQFSLPFKMVSHGRAFRTQLLMADQQNLHSIPYGVIRWNPDAAKLVIMDGQHRAMALLAIERTISNSWNACGKGARYEPFYRERVRSLLSADVQLDRIELPVTICWFPDTPSSSLRPQPHKAARKLFVDVNNTAKPPSRSRLVLLSDTELDNIFARELLNRLRDAEWSDRLPLFSVEYDNPRENTTTPRRWSVVTNLEILKACVTRSVFGPPNLIKKMDVSLMGRPNWGDMDAFMRQQLNTDALFPRHFHDGPRPMEMERLGHEYFPVNDDELRKRLVDAFFSRWGKGILHLLSSLEPYRAHIQAIKDRFVGWVPGNNIADLAKDALFEGVGMYWTLESEHNLWQQQRAEAPNGTPPPAQTDASKAWMMLISEQRDLFSKRRAELYLGGTDDDTVRESELVFSTLNTYAAQVGLVLAWAGVHFLTPNVDPSALARTIGDCLNRSLVGGPVASRNRRKVFLRSAEPALNDLPKLDTPYAVYFRYFWLELLLLNDNLNDLSAAGVNVNGAKALLDAARKHYLELLVDERAREVGRTDSSVRELPEAERKRAARGKAIEMVTEEQADAQKHWFGIPKNDARALIAAALAVPPVQPESGPETTTVGEVLEPNGVVEDAPGGGESASGESVTGDATTPS
jgi:hypothetical protein